MSIPTVSADTPVASALNSANWNQMARAVNGLSAPGGRQAMDKRASSNGPVMAWCREAVGVGMAVVPVAVSDAEHSGWQCAGATIEVRIYADADDPPYDAPIGATLASAPAKVAFPVVFVGLAAVPTGAGSADAFARPVDGGGWERAAGGGYPVVAGGPGYWAVIALGPRWLNVEAPGGSAEYEIDRTDAGDDAKTWNPASDAPSDWKDYATVTLITGTLRFNASGLPELVKVKRTWAACNAPVIAAVTSSEISDPTEEFECENA